MQLGHYSGGFIHAICIPGTPDHVSDLIGIYHLNSFYH